MTLVNGVSLGAGTCGVVVPLGGWGAYDLASTRKRWKVRQKVLLTVSALHDTCTTSVMPGMQPKTLPTTCIPSLLLLVAASKHAASSAKEFRGTQVSGSGCVSSLDRLRLPSEVCSPGAVEGLGEQGAFARGPRAEL